MAAQSPYLHQWEQFKAQTNSHTLEVLHRDGLYRHLRMQAPGTRMWSWDVITWPGYLATVGDVANGYMFTRIEDMLNFFDGADRDGVPYINPSYWAEKMPAGRDSVLTWAPGLFVTAVETAAVDNGLEQAAVLDLVERARWCSDSESEAYDWLRDNPELGDPVDIADGCRDYTHHFITACFAIVTTIRAYRALSADLAASDR